jgi:hypothetical protein
MAKRVAASTTKKKAAAGGAAKAKRAAGGNEKPAGGAAAKAAGKTKPAAANAREKPATAPAVACTALGDNSATSCATAPAAGVMHGSDAAAPCAALGGGDAVASRVTKLPEAALAPDVTRHDVNWGAQGARLNKRVVVSGNGSVLTLSHWMTSSYAWAQGATGVTRGKHFFSVDVTQSGDWIKVGWVDRALGTLGDSDDGPGLKSPKMRSSGATLSLRGGFYFGTAPLSGHQHTMNAPGVKCPCTIGLLLDLDAGAMTAFVNGTQMKEQCPYTFPTDGRAWFPTVGLFHGKDSLFSNAV